MPSDGPIATATLEGRFGRLQVPDVMSFLQLTSASGQLEVTAPEGEVVIWWGEGRVVASRARRGGIRTGDLLVRRGRLRPDEVEQAWEESRRSGERIGDAIVRLGLASRESVDAVLVEQAFENVYRLLTWGAVSFRFDEDRAAPPDAVAVLADVGNLLLEGARRCDEWSRLQPSFADPESLFEMVAEPEVSESISLSLNEWKLLYLVNGRRRLSDIWRESPMESDLETSRGLFGLAGAKLVRPSTRDAEPAPVVEPQPMQSVSVGESTSFELARRDTGALGPPGAADSPGTQILPRSSAEAPEALVTGVIETSVEVLHRDDLDIRPRARLISIDDPDEAKAFELETDVVTLGRSFDNHLVLVDPHVSQHHASLARKGDGYWLEDTDSHNGVSVNGRKVGRTLLRGGEQIDIYPYRFRFEVQFEISESGRRRPTLQLPRPATGPYRA